ncbi:toll/interleukin-1 receptor domain-containing protein [Thermoanaerobacterium thermosaccharolyticum]|jgi:TIR domain.|uniref:toll/interleukin-1 receptor domain-containing protein n=1 Tax=Thermoanaerobacterium thermosaccharolyticum TaxID=1517 RepID=UPI00279A21C5|nr:hypothetical protein [Thermoanaerobacterium sp.]WHE07134.1 toll/interleukin-1 receptor domain-containing protein [Thermoanaerobacterium thermosaccharolyticum]
MNYDMIFECDYGDRTPIKEQLKKLLDKFNASTMPMCSIFINNNPYSLEFYIVLNFKTDLPNLREDIINQFKNLGCKLRTDLNLTDFFEAMGQRQFNFCSLIDSKNCDFIFDNYFYFSEKKYLKSKLYNNQEMKPKNLIFISYSTADEEEVDQLVSELNRRSISIWYAKNNIDYGESIISKIEKAIDECVGVLFYITQNYLKSNWCELERETFSSRYASERNILMITIKDWNIEWNKLPSFLRNLKYIDRKEFKSMQDVAVELVPTIKKHLNNVKSYR